MIKGKIMIIHLFLAYVTDLFEMRIGLLIFSLPTFWGVIFCIGLAVCLGPLGLWLSPPVWPRGDYFCFSLFASLIFRRLILGTALMSLPPT